MLKFQRVLTGRRSSVITLGTYELWSHPTAKRSLSLVISSRERAAGSLGSYFWPERAKNRESTRKTKIATKLVMSRPSATPLLSFRNCSLGPAIDRFKSSVRSSVPRARLRVARRDIRNYITRRVDGRAYSLTNHWTARDCPRPFRELGLFPMSLFFTRRGAFKEPPGTRATRSIASITLRATRIALDL